VIGVTPPHVERAVERRAPANFTPAEALCGRRRCVRARAPPATLHYNPSFFSLRCGFCRAGRTVGYCRNSPGNLAMFAAMRRASSQANSRCANSCGNGRLPRWDEAQNSYAKSAISPRHWNPARRYRKAGPVYQRTALRSGRSRSATAMRRAAPRLSFLNQGAASVCNFAQTHLSFWLCITGLTEGALATAQTYHGCWGNAQHGFSLRALVERTAPCALRRKITETGIHLLDSEPVGAAGSQNSPVEG
jgi:hypothetical protein